MFCRAMSSVCHYFLRAGVIEYLGDCTHSMRGLKVPLPELPPELRDLPPAPQLVAAARADETARKAAAPPPIVERETKMFLPAWYRKL